MHPFNKLMEKKMKEGAHKQMSPVEKQAKMNAVKDMRKHVSDQMAEPLHSLKKVSVASDSPEGLQAGLEKAKQVVQQGPDMGDDGSQMLADGGFPNEKFPKQDDGMAGSLHDDDLEGLEEETGDDLEHDDERGEPVGHVAQVMEGHAEQHASDLNEHSTPDEIEAKIQELTKMKQLYHQKHGM